MSAGGGRALARVLACAACATAGARLHAGEAPTFARDVAPILYANCAPCHRPGGVGPFALLDYDSARRHARQIARVTRDGYMPPWLPVRGPVRYAGERGLDPQQVRTIAAWAAAGAPLGASADLPPAPEWKDGWLLGKPDLVLELPQPYPLAAGGGDVFRNLVIPVPLDRPRWVRAYELRPSPPQAVHHAVINVDRTRSARRLDALDPEPGYSGMTAASIRSFDGHIVAWTPGKTPGIGPSGTAWPIEPGSDLVLNLHMLPTGKPETVHASLGLYFADGPPAREPVLVRLGSQTLDIPPNEREYVIEDAYRLPVDADALVVYPHAHYLARTMEGWAELPDGTRRPLLRIDHWDFNWQDDYTFEAPIALPAGTRLRMRFTYDNSAENPRNPSSPPRRVRFGEHSSDEMGDLWIQLAAHDPADLGLLRRDFERKDLAAHLAGYESMLARFPDQVDYLDGAGLLYTRLGRLDDAERVLRRAVAVDPASSDARNHLGLVRQARGDGAGALALFREAVAADPQDAGCRVNLGVALRAAGDVPGAIEQYRAALGIEPDHPRAHANLGVALQSLGRLDEAIAHYRRAIELEPDSARSRYNLASALGSRGAWDEALGLYRRAVELEPEFVAAWSGMADAQAALGRFGDAADSARHALALVERSGDEGAARALRARIEEWKHRAASARDGHP